MYSIQIYWNNNKTRTEHNFFSSRRLLGNAADPESESKNECEIETREKKKKPESIQDNSIKTTKYK